MVTVETIDCLLCKSSEILQFTAGTKHLNLVPPLSVSRCASCGLLFLNPRPSAEARRLIYAGKMPEGLDQYIAKTANYGSVTHSRRSMFDQRVLRLARKLPTDIKISVLDIGCSSGEFMEAAIARGWKATGVEPSDDGVKVSQAKGLNVVKGLAEQLPFADSTFDVVHSNHVFEHLSDPMTAAKEAFRVLKPGGTLFIEVPNQFDNIQFFRYRVFGRIPIRRRDIRSIHHLFFFSRHTLRLLLAQAGFTKVQILNKYGRGRNGLGYLGSLFIRIIGKFYLGAPVIQAISIKRK